MNLQPVVQTPLACESAASVIATRSTPCTISRRYCPYGYTPTAAENTAPLGYHGELLLPVTSLHILGNGYRAYSPSLRRFLSSDSYSPFGRGGLNAYAAFSNNPINFKDPDGHAPVPLTLVETKRLLDAKASLIAGLQQEFSSQENLNGHRVLQNQLPERPGRDLATLHSKADVALANFSIIGSAKDLAHIGRRPQKFIFTTQAELIIGEPSKAVDFSHPHLTYFARGEKQVISAGMLMRYDNAYMLTNDTGHYHRSAEGIDTLAAPLAFLQAIGVNAIRQPPRK